MGEVSQFAGAAGGVEDLSVLAAEEHSGTRHRHHRLHCRLEPVSTQVEPTLLAVDPHLVTQNAGNIPGVVADGSLPLTDSVAVGEGDEGRAQHGEGYQDHPGHDEKLSLIETFQGQGAPFLLRVQVFSGVRTSNL